MVAWSYVKGAAKYICYRFDAVCDGRERKELTGFE